jgi:hypothetical protein
MWERALPATVSLLWERALPATVARLWERALRATLRLQTMTVARRPRSHKCH